ncbi:MAG: hypothetical protein AAFZ17_22370 [Cyanobacteria bacterium J06650_10]
MHIELVGECCQWRSRSLDVLDDRDRLRIRLTHFVLRQIVLRDVLGVNTFMTRSVY